MAKSTTSAAEQALADGAARQAAAVAETEERINNSRPTPTQEENDRAKLGILGDDTLADDGSPKVDEAAPAAPEAASDEAAPTHRRAAYRNRQAES